MKGTDKFAILEALARRVKSSPEEEFAEALRQVLQQLHSTTTAFADTTQADAVLSLEEHEVAMPDGISIACVSMEKQIDG